MIRTTARAMAAALAIALTAMTGCAAHAQTYPTKPVKLIVPYGPGGVADITSRLLAQKLSISLGQQIIVDNRPGAGGVVAGQVVASADPDGHTLLLLSNGTAISAALFRSLPYDTLNDFAPVSNVGVFPVLILVGKASPMKTVADLIATAKANPEKINVGAVNPGSTQELTAQLFKSSTGLNLTIVPFKTTPSLVTALTSDEIQVAFEIAAPVIGFVRDGALRPLAVSTAKRFEGLPDVPTVGESGVPGFEVVSWNAIAAPGKTPKPIIERLNKEILAALKEPDLRQKFADLGIKAEGGTPEQAKERLASEIGKWDRVIKDAGIPQQ